MASNLAAKYEQKTDIPDKRTLRREIKQRLSSLKEEEIYKQSASARDALLSLPEFEQAKRISIFMSMPGREISTAEIVDHALESGKQVFVPYIYRSATKGESVMDMLLLRSMEDRESLKPDKWGIPSLDEQSVGERENCFGGKGLTDGAPPTEEGKGLDVVVMPGMAFDRDFNRLGHGKAYYDTFIERCCIDGRRKPFLDPGTGLMTDEAKTETVGLALAEQILPKGYRLPTEQWDWPVDAVVVGDGTVTRAQK